MKRGFLMSLILRGARVIRFQIAAFIPRAICGAFREMSVEWNMAVIDRLGSNEDATFANPASGERSIRFDLPPDIDFFAKVLPTFAGHRHEGFDRHRAAWQFEIDYPNGSLPIRHVPHAFPAGAQRRA